MGNRALLLGWLVATQAALVGCGARTPLGEPVRPADAGVGVRDVARGGSDVGAVGFDASSVVDAASGLDVASPGIDVDLGPGGGAFVLSKMKLVTFAGAEVSVANSSFPWDVNIFFEDSLGSEMGFFTDYTLRLLAQLSSLAAGETLITICQADEGDATGPFKCRPDPPPVRVAGTIDAMGGLTSMPADVGFTLAAVGLDLNFVHFAMVGQLTASGLTNGTFAASLKTSDLCKANWVPPGAAGSNFCMGGVLNPTINLLDWADGPGGDGTCGQDKSATFPACVASSDTTTHFPADTLVGTPPEPAYSLTGTLAMKPAIIDP